MSARFTHRYDGIALPECHVEFRHPRLGWQVVACGDPVRCANDFKWWRETWPEYSVKVLKISGTQSWTVMLTHDGTHRYEGGA